MRQDRGLWGLWLAAGAALALINLLPLGFLAYGSLKTRDGLGLGRYAELFERFSFTAVLGNSWIYAGGTALLSMFLGVSLAVLVARTDLPGKRALRLVTTLAFVSPPWLTAMAYVFLASPNAGLINQLFFAVLGVKPLDVQTMTGMIVVSALFLYAFVFLTVEAALMAVDGAYEEAARIAGASRAGVIFRVTLPLVRPALISAGVFCLIIAWGLFATPAILGLPSRIYVFATQLYLFLNAFPPRLELAAAMGMIFCLSALALGLVLWLVRRPGARGRFAVIAGKGRRPALLPLGPMKAPALAFAWALSILAVLLPYLVIGFMSLNTAWYGEFSLERLSLRNYAYVLFEYSNTPVIIGNSLKLALSESVFVLALALAIAYLAERSRLPGRGLLVGLASFTVLIPSVAFVTGVLWAWIKPPFALYGTLTLIVLAQAARSLPVALRNLKDGFSQAEPALEEAARITGAGRLRIFFSITLPLLRFVLLGSFTIVFLSSLRDLNTPLFLGGGSTETLTLAVAIFHFWSEGQAGESAALTVLLVVITLLIFLPLYRWQSAAR